jgi:hypothetical protein
MSSRAHHYSLIPVLTFRETFLPSHYTVLLQWIMLLTSLQHGALESLGTISRPWRGTNVLLLKAGTVALFLSIVLVGVG